MKRALLLILTFTMLCCFCACGHSDVAVSDESAVESKDIDIDTAEEEAEPATEAECEESETTELKGILIAHYQEGDQYEYKSTGTYKCTTFTVDLDLIDPNTGSIEHLRTFSSKETISCSQPFFLATLGGNTTDSLRYFDSSFSKMTAVLTMKDGATHIGWITPDGNFTDISAMITSSNSFSGIVSHSSPYFFNGYLYFIDRTSEKSQYKRVPLDDISVESIEIMDDDVEYNSAYILPDGSIHDSLWSGNLAEYYDESLSYVAPLSLFTDWVEVDKFIGGGYDHNFNDDGMIYLYKLNDDQSDISMNNFYSEKIALLPVVKGRMNWGGIISNTGDTVAFLSRLTNSTDSSPHLFVTSIEGGEPTEIVCDYNMPNDYDSIGLLNWY